METKEINTTAWEAFCRKLQDIRPRLIIDHIESNGNRINVVNDLELREARFDGDDACSDVINLTLAEDKGEIVEYVITEPSISNCARRTAIATTASRSQPKMAHTFSPRDRVFVRTSSLIRCDPCTHAFRRHIKSCVIW